MTTDGPVVLLELAHQLHEDWPRVARALRNLAAAWEAERAQAAGRAAYLEPGHSCAGDPVCVVCALRSEVDKLRAQAAADRADLERARALANEIEREATANIHSPDTDASQMVVSAAVAETCVRLLAALGRGGAR